MNFTSVLCSNIHVTAVFFTETFNDLLTFHRFIYSETGVDREK